jgi:hypothetical protein
VVLVLAPQEYATGPQERKLFTIYSNQAKQSSRDSPGFWEKVDIAYYKCPYEKIKF